MSKITNYLNEHLAGDVVATDNDRRQFSTDASVLSLTPSLIAHPRIADDVRKIARFTWRLAERGQILPLTARGNGTDQTGAALGRGTVISFPAYMSNIMEFDLKYRMVRVQPGISMESLNQAVSTHGLRLPVDGGLSRAMTVSGAQATNLAGRQFAKYGCMRDWTDKLEVVLANGEIIQTGKLTRRELSEKKGLQTLEGEIYRSIDSLIDDNSELVQSLADRPTLDGGGYALDLVKSDKGTFDLTPLFLGSQGTLGIITQTILRLVEMSPETNMIVAALSSDDGTADLTARLLELEPSALEFIDESALKLVRDISGYQPWSDVTELLPKSLLFIEFDDKHAIRKVRKAAKILNVAGIADAKIATTPSEVDELMRIYGCVSAITNYNDDGTAAIPLMTEIAVLPESTMAAVENIRAILNRNHVEAGIWGNLGSGLITVRPLVNLANLGQRQVVFRLFEQINKVIQKFNGSVSGCSRGGRLLAPLVNQQYDKETVELFMKVKKIFDPYNILNAGVSDIEASRNEVIAMLRQNYDLDRLASYNLRG